MKTLVQTTIWIPDDKVSKRLDIIKRHLEYFKNYNGEWDLYIVNNCNYLHNEINNTVQENPNTKITISNFSNNPGWCYARNKAITKMIDEEYDLIIMMDCDIWLNNFNWIINSQKLSQTLPAFMIRVDEEQYRTGKRKVGRKNIEEFDIWLYDEWIGNINVLTKQTIEKVGGYDNKLFPQPWGLHDCEYGRRLLKSGLLNITGPYPSLAKQECMAVEDSEYDIKISGIKKQVNYFFPAFYQAQFLIQTGQKPIFFDYRQ